MLRGHTYLYSVSSAGTLSLQTVELADLESPREKMARLPKYAWPPASYPQSRKRKLDQLYKAAESVDANALMNAPAVNIRLHLRQATAEEEGSNRI